MTKNKILIAYYSRKGQNYVGSRIVNLPVENTEVAAKMAQELTGADIFESAPRSRIRLITPKRLKWQPWRNEIMHDLGFPLM